MTKPFKFKQFSVHQNDCAMKIGTDGVLLGAWTSIEHQPNSILDIGAGTGILALMMAQRSQAQVIDALEIDDNAHAQCVDNFEQSPWGDCLFCYHASLEEFTEEIEDRYDLIICNPPFYAEDYKTQNLQRDLARFQDAMPFEHLLKSAATLLSESGQFSVIIPFSEEQKFLEQAETLGLYPSHITHVKGREATPVKRSLIRLSFSKRNVEFNELIIETERHKYTEEYIKLTQDFYLKMSH
ncbi:tRNA1(Val) (adenine(37)-N6)-methyltransferase [Psychroserpens sp. BH13MA-6]